MKVALLLLAAVVAALVGASHASARQACTPGLGVDGRTFCGPAKATLKDRGKTYKFRQGGNCAISGSSFVLNIGTIQLHGKPKRAYIGITVFSKKAGTHDGAVTWQLHRKTVSLNDARVTLKRGLKKGTFTGKDGASKATGSFSCK